ncbi:MAG: acyl--CoA ligase [Hyphomicrobiaceae bacterium]|nr:acyl--CoA ligase [Hyphomicrobiaceae bacterium]
MKRFNKIGGGGLDSIPWGSELGSVAGRYAERIAVRDGSGEITYRTMFRKAAALAEGLRAASIETGEPVATLFSNGIPAVWAHYGVLLAGGAEVPINPALGGADIRTCLRIAKARLLLTTRGLAAPFQELGLEVVLTEDVGEAEVTPASFPPLPAGALARVVFTSGTTGLPKGAYHDHEGRWIANLLLRSSLPHAPGRDSRLLLMTPFAHGASLMTMAYHGGGATVTLLDGVDPGIALPMIARGEVDEVFAPPTVLAKLVDAAGDRALPGLKTIFCGTAVLTPTLYQRARRVFGPIVRVTYGKSEVFNPITVLAPAETEAWYCERGAGADACVGWAAPGVEIVVRTENGSTAGIGEEGEVLIRARHMMRGYLRGERFEPLAADGFHDTGDLGYVDSMGRLHLTGRIAEVIKTGGYKVTPEEVERALAPAVAPSTVAVLGIASEYWGQVIVAAVESPQPGWRERIEAAARDLTGYKRPRAFIAVEALPRNGIGKVRRASIRDHIACAYRLHDGPQPQLEARAQRADDP